jgi:hypothetical protein
VLELFIATESTEEHGKIFLSGIYIFVFFVDSVAKIVVFNRFNKHQLTSIAEWKPDGLYSQGKW